MGSGSKGVDDGEGGCERGGCSEGAGGSDKGAGGGEGVGGDGGEGAAAARTDWPWVILTRESIATMLDTISSSSGTSPSHAVIVCR
jgi:hypothetical protein